MIAPWLQEALYQEWDWRAALRRLAESLPRSAGPRATAYRELGLAFEHLEPDRRFAIATYRMAGPETDSGRALALALDAGWWEEVVALAMVERTTMGSLEALVTEARALLELGDRERAQRLVPAEPQAPRLAALRAELDGGSEAALRQWAALASSASGAEGAEVAEACAVVARLGRAQGRSDWRSWLGRGLAADPSHRWCYAMLVDERYVGDARYVATVLEVLRLRLAAFEERGQLGAWCDAARAVASRLWFGRHWEKTRGLARRLLASCLERAYQERLPEVPGHLASWAMLDDGATVDDTRVALLPLLVAALEAPLPAPDHVWLAALGADICARAGNSAAARTYAQIVAERAPLHPAARQWFGHSRSVPVVSEGELEGFLSALHGLEVGDCDELQIEDIVPLALDDELGLGPNVSSAAMTPPPSDGALAAALAGVDELELGAGVAEDAVIVDALAAVEASLYDAPDPGPSAPLRSARSTAVLGSEGFGSWAWARDAAGLARAPVAARRALGGGEVVDGEAGRRRATAAGPWPDSAKVPAPASPPAAAEPAAQAAKGPARATTGLIPGVAAEALAASRTGRQRSQAAPPLVEQRGAARATSPADLRLTLSGELVPMQVRDLSTTGLFAVTTHTPPIGAVLAGELRLVDEAFVERVYLVDLKVVRRSALGVGLAFVAPSAALAAALAALVETKRRALT